MDVLLAMLTQWRRYMLARQAAVVRQAVQGLSADQRRLTAEQTLSEIQAASRLPLPHLHGDTAAPLYRPWSPVAARSAARVRDRSLQLRQRSIATWLAVVYHETRGAADEGLLAVHRQVLGMLRELKDNKTAEAPEKAWFKAAA